MRPRWWARSRRAAIALFVLGMCTQARAAGPDRSVPPPLAAPAPPPPLRLVEARLHNGVRVLLDERHDVPTVALSIVSAPWRDARLPAQLLSAAAFAGTREHPDGSYAQALGDAGIVAGSIGSPDGVVLHFRTVTPVLPQAASLAAELLSEASFGKRAVALAQAHVHEELARQRTDASNALERVLFPPGHTYHPMDGTLVDVACLDASAWGATWRAQLDPATLTVVVVGDARATTLFPLLARTFGALPPATRLPPKPPARRPSPSTLPHYDTSSPLLLDVRTHEGATIVLGGAAPPGSAPDRPTLALLGEIAASRAERILRDRLGISYVVLFEMPLRRGAGSWTVWTHVPTSHVAEALRVLQTEIDRLRGEPMSLPELAHERTRFLALRAADRRSTIGLSSSLYDLALLRLDPSELVRRDRRLLELSPEDVQRVADATFESTHVYRLIVGDGRQVVRALAAEGLPPATPLRGYR